MQTLTCTDMQGKSLKQRPEHILHTNTYTEHRGVHLINFPFTELTTFSNESLSMLGCVALLSSYPIRILGYTLIPDN